MSDHSDSPTPGGRNLLLQTGEDGDCEESACMDLLGVEDSAGVDVLFVTFTKSADDRLEALKRHADAPPARVGVVSVEVGGSNGGDRVGGAGGPTVRRISDPSDLTGVGIAISEFLSAWSGDGNRTVVCFESLTALLQYVDASRVFQFCNEITSKFEQAGATAHFHITPEAHERQELSVLSSLFDGRVGAGDLGYGPDADSPGTRREESGAPTAAGGTPDETGEEDPFEYAVAEEPGDAADGGEEVNSTDDGDSGGTGTEEEPANDADPGADTDPADLVSSVMAGETPGEPGEGDPGPSLDADVPESDRTDEDAADPDDPEPRTRQSESEESTSRLEYIGPEASSSGRMEVDEPGDGGDDDAGGAAGSDDQSDRSEKYAIYQRTTATVVGVVAMLVLISFLSAAMPVPVTPDDAAHGADVEPTATPEEVAAANDSATETATATEDASTPTPTATATPTPTPDSSTSSSSSSGSSDDGSTSDPTATPTATATPTPTPTSTPSDDDLIDDTLDTTDDTL